MENYLVQNIHDIEIKINDSLTNFYALVKQVVIDKLTEIDNTLLLNDYDISITGGYNIHLYGEDFGLSIDVQSNSSADFAGIVIKEHSIESLTSDFYDELTPELEPMRKALNNPALIETVRDMINSFKYNIIDLTITLYETELERFKLKKEHI